LRLNSGPVSDYLKEPCPVCLAEPVFDREMHSCRSCGYVFPLVFVVPYDFQWHYSPDMLEAFAAHDGLRLMGKFTGREPEHLASLAHLRYLYVSRYPGFTFSWLSGFGRLLSLELDYAGLESLEGIGVLRALACLRLTECRHLADISALATLPALRYLRVALCNRIEDWRPVASLRSLESLLIEGRHLGTLEFLRPLRNLGRLALAVPRLPADLCEVLTELPSLRRLGLRKRYATKGFLADMTKRCPQCQVETL
jgi:hypothetical protein